MINKYIKVEQGSYRGHDMSGRVFPILKDYQTFAGDKQGGFVTVDCSELDGFEGLDKARVNVADIGKLTLTTEGAYIIHRDSLKADATGTTAKATPENRETDSEAIERIAARFSILDEMAEAVSTSKIRAMIVSGPPGIGKSYGVERALEKQSMFEDISGSERKFEVVKGAMSAIGLYKKLYEHSAKGHVVCFDDCDAVLYDDLALNLLKAALDTGRKRTLQWGTESRFLHAEGVPNSFDFNAGIIFITNVKFDNVKSKKLRDHLEALSSRCHYLDLTIDSMRDRMLRIKQICREGLLKKYDMSREKEAELVDFIFTNRTRLREVSLRMVLKIADLWRMAPDRYQALAQSTCMRAGV